MTYFAAIQMNSGPCFETNLKTARDLIETAAHQGAKVVALPETFAFIGPEERLEPVSLEHPALLGLGELAKKWGVFLLAGSVHEPIKGSSKCFNTSVTFSPQGELLSVYRKIHLFDIDSPHVQLKESLSFEAGGADQIEVMETPYGKWGNSICYDLRFPELYRRFSQKGVELMFVPAAFTYPTGQAHWEILLRARAIENQCFIIAPNQWGEHGGSRHSYGHSMIIDPWGKILAQKKTGVGVIYAELDFDRLREVRQNLPCLEHRIIH